VKKYGWEAVKKVEEELSRERGKRKAAEVKTIEELKQRVEKISGKPSEKIKEEQERLGKLIATAKTPAEKQALIESARKLKWEIEKREGRKPQAMPTEYPKTAEFFQRTAKEAGYKGWGRGEEVYVCLDCGHRWKVKK